MGCVCFPPHLSIISFMSFSIQFSFLKGVFVHSQLVISVREAAKGRCSFVVLMKTVVVFIDYALIPVDYGLSPLKKWQIFHCKQPVKQQWEIGCNCNHNKCFSLALAGNAMHYINNYFDLADSFVQIYLRQIANYKQSEWTRYNGGKKFIPNCIWCTVFNPGCCIVNCYASAYSCI